MYFDGQGTQILPCSKIPGGGGGGGEGGGAGSWSVFPGVSVVGLVINEELCEVVWRIIIKNFMHKYSFIVSELLW